MKRLALTVLLAMLAGPSMGAELSPYDVRTATGMAMYLKGYKGPTEEQQREQLIESRRYAGRQAGIAYYKKLGGLAGRLTDRSVAVRAENFAKLQLRGDDAKYRKLWAACFVQGWQGAKDPDKFPVVEYPLFKEIVYPPVFFEGDG